MKVILFSLVALLTVSSTIFGQLNSFSISVEADDTGLCDFEFYKYSTRTATQQIFTWDGTTLTPYTPGTVRTYRGTITNHPNYKAMAVWYPDGKLYIKAMRGKGENADFEISDIELSDYTLTPLNLPIVTEPMKSIRSLASGYSCSYPDFIDPTKGNGDIETLVAMWENGVNQVDYFSTRDLGLSVTTDLLVIPTDPSIATVDDIIDPRDYPSQITEIPMFWKTKGYGGGVAGATNWCGNPFKGGRTSFFKSTMGAMPHEFGHNMNMLHTNNQVDAMDGNQFFWGRNSVAVAKDRLTNGQNDCILNPNPSYTDYVHPRCEEDYIISAVNQPIIIDVLANDIDYNGDAVSINSFDGTSENGGTIVQQGSTLEYTPPSNFLGRDYFSYECQSGTGDGFFTNGAKVFIEVRDPDPLALHYSFDQNSGTTVLDEAWGIDSHNGELRNVDFAANSIPGVIGNALDLPSSDGIILKDILDPIDQDLSISIWFKVYNLPQTDEKMIIFDSGSRGKLAHSGLSIMIDEDGLHFQAQTESINWAGAQLDYTPTLALDEWYHAAMVVDRTTNTLRAYIDGQEVTYSEDNNIDLNPNVIIKGYPGGYKKLHHVGDPSKYRSATTLGMRTEERPDDFVDVLNGALDEFKIFTKAVTPAEVADLYQNLPLPIELLSFSALVLDKEVSLIWETTSELNNEKFEVEESLNGQDFQKIGVVKGKGTTVQKQHYSFDVQNPRNGTTYYRLKQIDFDGLFEYSKIISVNFNGDKRVIGEFYPNPSKSGIVNLNYYSLVEEEITISVFDITGKLVINDIQQVLNRENNLSFDFSDLNKGIYIARIGDKTNPVYRKIIIEKERK